MTFKKSKPGFFMILSYWEILGEIYLRKQTNSRPRNIIIENKVIIEVKSVELVAPVHQKQLLTYLRITGLKLGLLVNFNEALIKDGIQRILNKL